MRKVLAVVLCLVLAAFVLTACAQKPVDEPDASAPVDSEEPAPEESEAPADDPLVGILVPAAPTGWVAAVQYYAKLEADELGLNYKIAASANPNEQANQVDEFISLGCEIIILMPHNDELAVAAQKIMDNGITLINYDRTVNPTEPDYYVAGDNYDMGVKGRRIHRRETGQHRRRGHRGYPELRRRRQRTAHQGIQGHHCGDRPPTSIYWGSTPPRTARPSRAWPS